MQQAVDPTNSFKYAWAKLQQNVGPIAIGVGIWIAVIVVTYVIGFFALGAVSSIFTTTETYGSMELTTDDGGFFAFLVIIALWALLVMVAQFAGSFAITRAGLAITGGRPLTTAEIFKTDNLVPFLLTSLLSSVIIGVGTLLCVVPGIIASFLLWFAPYFALENGMSPVDAIKASFETVKQNLGPVAIFLLLAMAANAVGGLLCGIGTLVALPTIMIASAHMFRTLTGQPIAA